jgi:ABC-type multidrug transport system fused ATPase/permease subunit/pSer/pThr/pTyr-binding forkhead associated (FHA) protein
VVAQLIEIREPGRPARRVTVADSVEVGRDCAGIILSDPEVSRRHLTLHYVDGAISVLDLGSSNGTSVNGVPAVTETALQAGDVIELGDSHIMVLNPPDRQDPVEVATQPMVVGPDAGEPRATDSSVRAAPAMAQARPALDELASRNTEAAVIRYRPGTAGEKVASSYGSAVRRARRRLAGFGSEPWGVRPQICLVDPFPSPDDPNELLVAGTVVDAARGEIWMVVTAEAPPESPERALALFFGAELPASGEVAELVEGYGLHLAELPTPDPYLAGQVLPPLARAEGQLRALMAVSFVRHLLARGGEPELRRLLATAQPGTVDAVAEQIYGLKLAVLEQRWRDSLAAPEAQTGSAPFRRLVGQYLRRSRWRLIQLTFCMVAGLALVVLFPFALRRLVDRVLPAGDLAGALAIVAVLAGVFVVVVLSQVRAAQLWARLSSSLAQQLRSDMFHRLQTLPPGWYAARQRRSEVLSSLLADVNMVASGLQTVREGATQALLLIATTAVLLILNLPLALAVLLGAGLLSLVVRSLDRRAARHARDMQEQMTGLLSVAAESYAAHAVVQSFGLEADQRSRFRRALDHLAGRQYAAQFSGSLPAATFDATATGLRLVVLAVGAWLVSAGQLTVGGLVAVVILTGQALRPVNTLTGIGRRLQPTAGAVTRISDILTAEGDVVDDPAAVSLPRLRRDIRLSGVSLPEGPGCPPLADVDAVIPAGSRVAFVGPAGAGTSVLHLLLRFADPAAGTVVFDGLDLRQVALASLRSQLGVLFRDALLFDATIAENIAVGSPRAGRSAIEAAARAAQAHQFIVTMPQGYDTRVGASDVQLSQGQRQRIALARALLRDPSVLLLDEVTADLDVRTDRLLAETLERIGRNRTVIAATRRLTSVVGFDRIYVLDGGRIVDEGRHEELLARGGGYAEWWAEQTHTDAAGPTAFDLPAALARVPLFAGLDRPGLDRVAGALHEQWIERDETLSDDGGRLVLIKRGRGVVLVRDPAEGLSRVAELGPGEAFGLGAVMGQRTGYVLRAQRRLQLLVLRPEALAALALELPSVGAALDTAPSPAVPAGGDRLSQVALPARLSGDHLVR